MGFQRGTITLAWSEQHLLHGLEVVCRRRPFGEVHDDWRSEDPSRKEWDDLGTPERAERALESACRFADLIVSWNLDDDDGRPVELPPRALPEWSSDEREARWRERGELVLRHCDFEMITDMREAYDDASSRVAPPLPQSSEPGPGANTTPATTTAPEPPEDWGMAHLQEGVGVSS